MKRFWDKVHKLPGIDTCWIWLGSLNRGGYGQFKLDGKVRRSHQVSWKIEKGEWCSYLRHTCDTPACVNPAHLLPGDNKSNMQDKYNRGRANHYARFTDHQVRRIRRVYVLGISSTHIAKVTKIPKCTVLNIINGHAHKNTGGPIRRPGTRLQGNRFQNSVLHNSRSATRFLTIM